MNNPSVSVIVPVYGVEKYIERCARSLFEQTLDDIEFVFVDDCTPDNSISVLQRVIEDYPMRKSQVNILHHERNKGLPEARRTGILAAKGDFLAHCDSDDWVERDAYRLMYEKAMEEGADVVVCDYNGTDGIEVSRTERGCSSINKEMYIQKLFYNDSWAVWNKLFRRTTCCRSDFVFPKGNMGEDMVLSFQQILNAGKVAYIPKPLYNYFCNPASITQTPDNEKIYRNITHLKDNTDIVLNLFERKGLSKKFHNELLVLKYKTKTNAMPLCMEKKYLSFWRGIYSEINSKMLFMHVTFMEKVHFYICLFGLAPILRKRNG